MYRCYLWCTALAIASDTMTEAISGERAVLNPNCIRKGSWACLLCGDEAGILEDLLYGRSMFQLYLCGETEVSCL